MNKERIFYFLVIIACIYAVYIFYTKNDPQDYIDEYNKRIELLDSKIDSLHSENDLLINEVDSLNTTIEGLDKEILEQDSALSNLKQQTDEKINSVNSFSNSELAKFFAERYGYDISSIIK